MTVKVRPWEKEAPRVTIRSTYVESCGSHAFQTWHLQARQYFSVRLHNVPLPEASVPLKQDSFAVDP